MSNTITVWYNGLALSVFKTVANSLNLKNGYRIKTESEFWQVLGANSSHGISLCEHGIDQDVKQN